MILFSARSEGSLNWACCLKWRVSRGSDISSGEKQKTVVKHSRLSRLACNIYPWACVGPAAYMYLIPYISYVYEVQLVPCSTSAAMYHMLICATLQ